VRHRRFLAFLWGLPAQESPGDDDRTGGWHTHQGHQTKVVAQPAAIDGIDPPTYQLPLIECLDPCCLRVQPDRLAHPTQGIAASVSGWQGNDSSCRPCELRCRWLLPERICTGAQPNCKSTAGSRKSTSLAPLREAASTNGNVASVRSSTSSGTPARSRYTSSSSKTAKIPNSWCKATNSSKGPTSHRRGQIRAVAPSQRLCYRGFIVAIPCHLLPPLELPF